MTEVTGPTSPRAGRPGRSGPAPPPVGLALLVGRAARLWVRRRRPGAVSGRHLGVSATLLGRTTLGAEFHARGPTPEHRGGDRAARGGEHGDSREHPRPDAPAWRPRGGPPGRGLGPRPPHRP